MHIRIGTRGSRLALAQSEEVIELLQKAYPMHIFEICIIKTKGDRIQHIALDKMNDKGIFVKEIEQQLLAGQIDIAVHSMKDMPSHPCKGLGFTKTLLREDARDVLVLAQAKSLGDLPFGASIATGSKRRKYQLLKARPDLKIVGIRGNIDTRIEKMKEQGLDGIVLAAAGLHRLHLEAYATVYLSQDVMVPAIAQGAIAIEVKQDREDIAKLVNALCDDVVDAQVQVERTFLQIMDGGCHTPIGAACQIEKEQVRLCALYGNEDGTIVERVELCKKLQDIDTIANEAAIQLKKKVLGE